MGCFPSPTVWSPTVPLGCLSDTERDTDQHGGDRSAEGLVAEEAVDGDNRVRFRYRATFPRISQSTQNQ